jgi:hypothetical protein
MIKKPEKNVQRRQPLMETTGVSDMINQTGEFYNSVVDNLLLAGARSEGRKRKLKERQEEEQNDLALIEKIRKLGNIKSGKLASINCFTLDNNVKQVLKEQDDEARIEDERIKVSNEEKKAKSDKRYNEAKVKYVAGIKLNGEDMRALLRKVPKIPNVKDSPLKEKVVDLSIQFSRREQRLVNHLRETGTMVTNGTMVGVTVGNNTIGAYNNNSVHGNSHNGVRENNNHNNGGLFPDNKNSERDNNNNNGG